MTRTPRIPADLSGLSVGRFVIEGRLGSGGMGQVYQAQDTTLKRTVAIKRMAPHLSLQDAERQRFLKEAQRASGLNHPNIAAVYDVIEFEGELFLVMEYIDGTTLRQRLSGRPLDTAEFLDIATQCAEGLAVAHENGIVHGDIKPENIMLTPAGRVKILDFGVARRFAANPVEATQTLLTTTAAASGTPAYMAPEVLQNRPYDGRVDLFSLGLVFYEMLGGRQPFAADTFAATAGRVLHVEPLPIRESNSTVPESIAEIVGSLIKKEPALRPTTAADLLRDLRMVASGGTLFISNRAAAGSLASRLFCRRTAVIAAAVTVLLATSLWTVNYIIRNRQRPPATSTAELPQTRILAILPMSPAGQDPKTIALARGLSQSVAAKLGRLGQERSFEVIPASNMQDKGIATLDDARKQFGATLGLTVNLQESSGMVRVAYSLLDALSGRFLGGDSVAVPANDIFALEDSVAQGTVAALRLNLNSDEQTALKVRGTTVAAAYNHYIQSRGYLLNWTTPENVDNAILLLRQAIKLDPNFGIAKAALGEAYWRKYWHTKQASWTKLARTECYQAVSLGNSGTAGHACLGLVSDGSGDYEKAVSEYRRAIELDPRDETAAIGLALALEHQGKPTQAEDVYRQTVAAHPQSWTAINMLGTFYFRQNNFPKASEAFKKVTSLAPEGYAGYVNLGAVYNNSGRRQDAIDVLKKSILMRPSYAAYVNLGNAYFYLHDFASAAKAYEEATKLNPKQYPTWGNLAEALYYSGAKDKAAPAYHKAIELAKEDLKINPKDAVVHAYVAGYYSMLGERKQSLQYLQQALKFGSNDKEVYLMAASVYSQIGETGLALEWLSKTIQSGYKPEALRDSPAFASLKGNPRYQEIMGSDKN